MVKDHSDSERGNSLPLHVLLFPISSKGYFIYTIPQTRKHIPRPVMHLIPHSLSLEFIGIGQECVLSVVYVGHSCSMFSVSCVPVPQGHSMDGDILRRCIWDCRRQWQVLSRTIIQII